MLKFLQRNCVAQRAPFRIAQRPIIKLLIRAALDSFSTSFGSFFFFAFPRRNSNPFVWFAREMKVGGREFRENDLVLPDDVAAIALGAQAKVLVTRPIRAEFFGVGIAVVGAIVVLGPGAALAKKWFQQRGFAEPREQRKSRESRKVP